MAGVEKFEDLIACQKARELAKAIYQVSRSFLGIAKASCAEVRSQLYIPLDETGRVLNGLLLSVRKKL